MTPEELRADGCELLGSYYSSEKDYSTAMDWYLKASDLGSTIAMVHIGLMYYDGMGVKRDNAVSLEWICRAANLGNVYAMNWYGYLLCQDKVASELLKQGEYATENELLNAAVKWFEKAADAGHATAMNNIGYYNYDKQGSYELAREWYEKAARKGNTTAMLNLANSHYTHLVMYRGESFPYGSYNNAMKWLIKAYVNGHDGVDKQDINYMLSKKLGLDAYFENYAELIFANP